ncbi:hypothetical protein F5Y08DRAFT_321379 [Xylaria arbuscula]|nr:hypothetical protein F5Y08DRAFT_321379 [Xylaria arbuscula]
MYAIDVVSGVVTYKDIQSQYGRFRINHTDPVPHKELRIDGVCFTSSYDSGLYPPFPNDTNSHGTSLGNTTLSFCWHFDGIHWPFDISGGDLEWFKWGSYLATNLFTTESKSATYLLNSDKDFAARVSPSTKVPRDSLGIVGAKSLKQLMPGITASMNNAWRDMSQERVTGTYTYSETIFSISWAWIVLPVTLNIFGYIVLISVIRASMHTGHSRLWKGSTLASLYHGLQEECIPDNVETVEAMEKSAATTLVELKFVDKEGRVLLSK